MTVEQRRGQKEHVSVCILKIKIILLLFFICFNTMNGISLFICYLLFCFHRYPWPSQPKQAATNAAKAVLRHACARLAHQRLDSALNHLSINLVFVFERSQRRKLNSSDRSSQLQVQVLLLQLKLLFCLRMPVQNLSTIVYLVHTVLSVVGP